MPLLRGGGGCAPSRYRMQCSRRTCSRAPRPRSIGRASACLLSSIRSTHLSRTAGMTTQWPSGLRCRSGALSSLSATAASPSSGSIGAVSWIRFKICPASLSFSRAAARWLSSRAPLFTIGCGASSRCLSLSRCTRSTSGPPAMRRFPCTSSCARWPAVTSKASTASPSTRPSALCPRTRSVFSPALRRRAAVHGSSTRA
mmetsp:Transcript_25063/g.62110  ORF Transcript_25063/g.62110 Transcript_25063/m.62110 type:complete len:200 (+) Transcript_25063:122-721(+)